MSGISATTAAHRRSRSVVSSPTIAIAALFVGLLALHYWLVSSEVFGVTTSLWISDLGSALLNLFAAAVILWVAYLFGEGERIRTRWAMMGASVLVFALGDLVWSYLELVRGIDPYPSVADVLYISVYFLFGAAVIMALRAYRGLVPLRKPMILAGSATIVAVALVYATLLMPYILPAGPDELTPLGKALSVGYPLGDVLFMVGPALMLAIVLGSFGAGRFAVPWWFVVAGAILFAVTDSWYSYVDWSGTGYITLLDSGWIAANMLLAMGALLARDVNRV